MILWLQTSEASENFCNPNDECKGRYTSSFMDAFTRKQRENEPYVIIKIKTEFVYQTINGMLYTVYNIPYIVRRHKNMDERDPTT